MAEQPGQSQQKSGNQKVTPLDALKKGFDEVKVNVSTFFSKISPVKKQEVTYHRRLICCKLNDAARLPRAIEDLKQIGFKEITEKELFGRRGSRIMLEYPLDDKINRLHLRVHAIDITCYFLIHKEPIPSTNVNNLTFHVRGFFDRVSRQFNEYMLNWKTPTDKVSVNYHERAELSNYEEGCSLFRDLVKNKNMDLYNSLNFYLDNTDFLAFSLKFGNVSNVLPAELLINDFKKNKESDQYMGLSENVRTILEMLGFRNIKTLPLKEKLGFLNIVPDRKSEIENIIDIYHCKEGFPDYTFFSIFSKQPLQLETIAKFVEYQHVLERAHIIVIICEDAPVSDSQKDTKKLRKKDIYASTIRTEEFLNLLEKFLSAPFSIEKLLNLVETRDSIDKDCIKELNREKTENQQLSRVVLGVLDYLEKNPGWHHSKEITRIVLKNRDFSNLKEDNMEHILDLLRNPLLELVISKKNGKELKGIENKEELRLKLSNMKSVFNSIDVFH
nr:hypothetical protein [Candidatus Sigynarchaeota archaeon]